MGAAISQRRISNFYAEGLWQGYRERQLDQACGRNRCGAAEATGQPDLSPRNTNQIVSGTVHATGELAAALDSDAWGFKGATHRATNTYQFAVGGSYDAGTASHHRETSRTRTAISSCAPRASIIRSPHPPTIDGELVHWLPGERGRSHVPGGLASIPLTPPTISIVGSSRTTRIRRARIGRRVSTSSTIRTSTSSRRSSGGLAT